MGTENAMGVEEIKALLPHRYPFLLVDRVEELLREAHGHGRTIVLVTHNLYQARRLGQETWFLLGGRIVERGPSERLFVRPREALTRAYVAGEMVY